MALILIEQIIVLFLMMGCGLAVVKLGMLKVEDSKALLVITLYLLLPSVVIHSLILSIRRRLCLDFCLHWQRHWLFMSYCLLFVQY